MGLKRRLKGNWWWCGRFRCANEKCFIFVSKDMNGYENYRSEYAAGLQIQRSGGAVGLLRYSTALLAQHFSKFNLKLEAVRVGLSLMRASPSVNGGEFEIS